ncbi:Serine/threonine-protein kinase grp, partial [Pseudolycoriella hygida]
MSLNPSTPDRRHQFPHDQLPPSRIPQPSPQLLRRSLSLRLRNTTLNALDNDPTYSKSPTKSPFTQRRRQNCLNSNSIQKNQLPSSKSLTNIESMAEQNGHLNGKVDTVDGEIPDGIKSSPQSVTVCCKQASKNCLAKSQHGMSLSLTNHCDNGTTQRTQNRSAQTPQSPHTPAGLPPNYKHKLTPQTPPQTPESPLNGYPDDDLESVFSYTSMASGRSAMSTCEHPHVARNGTTFSGRKMKYVVHCSSYAGQTGEDYLTPTQRAQKHIRRLKILLSQAKMDLEQRDSEILRLTKEVVELRLFKASLSSPEERSNSSDAITVREMNDPKTSLDVSPIVDTDVIDDGSKSSPRHVMYHGNLNPAHVYLEKVSHSEMQSSFADSGHFEDITTSSINSKDSFVQTRDVACGDDTDDLVKMYEQKIEELIKNQNDEKREARDSQSRVEGLLIKLAECNERYADLVPDYEQAKEKIRELEKHLEDLQKKLQEQEDKQNKMYLHMYTKGQEAAPISHADKFLEMANQPGAVSRLSVPELIHQLQVTQNELENIRTMYRRLIEAQQSKSKVDPEVTLQFLKSAIYYFLTDKDNTQGHLNAIERRKKKQVSILKLKLVRRLQCWMSIIFIYSFQCFWNKKILCMCLVRRTKYFNVKKIRNLCKKVKLLINKRSGDTMAMKMIDLQRHPDAKDSVRKEVGIQRLLSHKHILRFFGKRTELDIEYIFLEYAVGGELFDRIEPDLGMEKHSAQRYFKQLLAGVTYLHSKGVAHRDIKPENLLLDKDDNLKISDFGMATLFRVQGKERLLDKRCGTLPYVAPEVLLGAYRAQPADIWSCAIVLVAMLSGDLPWDIPASDSAPYIKWKSNDLWTAALPWRKVDTLALSLLRKTLDPNPSKRLSLDAVVEHKWCNMKFESSDYQRNQDCNDSSQPPHKRKRNNDNAYQLNDDNSHVQQSQPAQDTLQRNVVRDIEAWNSCFSQPANLDDLLLNSQMNPVTQSSTQNVFQKLVRRMTRFFISTDFDQTIKRLSHIFDSLGYTWKINDCGMISISTIDQRKLLLVFKANLVEMDGNILLDFRLSKGCGLEFKRRFIKIKSMLT